MSRAQTKRKLPRFFLAIFLLLAPGVSAQQKGGSLELHLHPEALKGSVPQAFTFALVNLSGHEVRLPAPSLPCSDGLAGSIWLHVEFTLLKPGTRGGNSGGCAGDTMGWPPITERIKSWKVLQPGESLSLHATREQLYYDDQQPGTYDFWAVYTPPVISSVDQELLRGLGIDFPHGSLTSGHLKFVKAP